MLAQPKKSLAGTAEEQQLKALTEAPTSGGSSPQLATVRPPNPHWADVLFNPFASLVPYGSLVALADRNSDGQEQVLAVCEKKAAVAQPTPRVVLNAANKSSANATAKSAPPAAVRCVTAMNASGIQWEREIPCEQRPISMCTFYNDNAEDGPPWYAVTAIAAGSMVHLFKKDRQLPSITVPAVKPDDAEQEIWDRFVNDRIESASRLLEELQALVGRVRLSTRSRAFLNVQDDEERSLFAEELRFNHTTYKPKDFITCMATIRKATADEHAPSHLVVCTEHHKVYVYETSKFTIVQEFDVGSPVCAISTYGLFEVSYHFTLACRDGNVYLLSNNTFKRVAQMEKWCISVLATSKSIRIASMDNTITRYSLEGNQTKRFAMPANILAFAEFHYAPRNIRGWMVSLANQQVRLFIRDTLISIIEVEEPLTSIRFGKVGTEDAMFVGVTVSGGFVLKKLRKDVELDQIHPTSTGNTILDMQQQPLLLPAKTKLFLEQRTREVKDAKEMHECFQKDLVKLRLQAARTYVKTMSNAIGPVSTAATIPLKLDVEIIGIGPIFTLRLLIQYVGQGSMGYGPLFLNVFGNPSVYRVTPSLQVLPALVSGIQYTLMAQVENTSVSVLADAVEISIQDARQTRPLILTTILMPMNQSLVIDPQQQQQ